MGILSKWRKWRNACLFEKVGVDCEFPSVPLEVKGHVELGAGCVVRGNAVFRTHMGGRIRIGDRVELADYAMIASNARIEIGSDTYIGPHCVIRDINHAFQGTDAHWRLTPHITKPIVIGPRCYLGARSYVMPGVTIGEGAVVAPGSVVTRDIGPCEVWAGAPTAQFIAHRTDPGRGPSRKRHAELLRLYGFEVESQETEVADEATDGGVDQAAPSERPEASAPRHARKVRSSPRKKDAAKKKTASKAAPVRVSTQTKGAVAGKRRNSAAPAKNAGKKLSAGNPSGAARGGKSKGISARGTTETPAAVRKALADASDVLKSFVDDH